MKVHSDGILFEYFPGWQNSATQAEICHKMSFECVSKSCAFSLTNDLFRISTRQRVRDFLGNSKMPVASKVIKHQRCSKKKSSLEKNS